MSMANAFEALTIEEEQAEWQAVIRQRAILRAEKPQDDFRGGWLRMWTIMSPLYDKNGFNRLHGTFTLTGLKELKII